MDPPKVMLHVYDPLIPEGLNKVFIKACQHIQLVATPASRAHGGFLEKSCKPGSLMASLCVSCGSWMVRYGFMGLLKGHRKAHSGFHGEGTEFLL